MKSNMQSCSPYYPSTATSVVQSSPQHSTLGSLVSQLDLAGPVNQTPYIIAPVNSSFANVPPDASKETLTSVLADHLYTNFVTDHGNTYLCSASNPGKGLLVQQCNNSKTPTLGKSAHVSSTVPITLSDGSSGLLFITDQTVGGKIDSNSLQNVYSCSL